MRAAELRVWIEAHPDPLWVVDADTWQFVEVNTLAARDLGRSRTWFEGRGLAGVRTEPALTELLTRPRAARAAISGWALRCWPRPGRGKAVNLRIRGRTIRFAGRRVWLLVVHPADDLGGGGEGLAWRLRRDELLSRTAMRLLESRDPQALIESLCREAMSVLGADIFVNLLADPDVRRLRLNASGGLRPDESQAFESLEYAATECGRVAVTRQAACLGRIGRSSSRRTALLRSLGVQAYCTHPLLEEGRLLGTLSFGSRSRNSFTPPESELMERVAHLVSIALHRMRTEEAAQVVRARLEAALESMTDAVFISDIDGRFVEFNEAFATFHRFASKRECARTLLEYPKFLDVSFPDGSPTPLDQWAVPRALRGETVVNAEYQLHRRDTGESWVGSYNFAPIRDPQGRIVGSVVVGRDITEAKRAAEALRSSEERLSLAQRAGNVGVFDWDLVTQKAFWTPELEEIFGLKPGTFEGVYAGWARRVVPEDLRRIEAVFHEWIRSDRDRMAWEYRILRADGEIRWIASRAEIFRDSSGRPVRMVGTNLDITERKRAEGIILESETRLRTVMNTVFVGFIIIDESGIIQDVNRGTCTMFGYEPAELVGQNVNRLMPSPDRERHDGYLAQYRRTGRKQIIGTGREVMARRKDGSLFPVELSVAEFTADGGRLFAGTLRDVGPRRRLEAEVVTAFERAQQEMGADLHDGLGQHLHGIKYLAADLRERLRHRKAPEAAEMQRFVDLMDQAIEQARSIVRGLTPVEGVPEGLEWGLRRLARELGELHRNNVRFQCRTPVRVGNRMVARHLYRIAQEAAGNSLRHSKCSQVVITLAATPEHLVIGVRDNGTGLGPRGAGMGLHVMQYRANAIRGSLAIHSKAGRGTEVVCSVPWSMAGEEPPAAAPPPPKPPA